MENLKHHFFILGQAHLYPRNYRSIVKKMVDCKTRGHEIITSVDKVFDFIRICPWTSMDDLALRCCIGTEDLARLLEPFVLFTQLTNEKSLILPRDDVRRFGAAQVAFGRANRVLSCLKMGKRLCYFSAWNHIYLAWYCRTEEMVDSISDPMFCAPMVQIDTDPARLVIDVAAQIIVSGGEGRFAVYDPLVWNLNETACIVQDQLKPYFLQSFNPLGADLERVIEAAVDRPGDVLVNLQLLLTEAIIGQGIKTFLRFCEYVVDRSGVK